MINKGLIVSSPNNGGLIYINKSEEVTVIDRTDTVGLCFHNNILYRAIQHIDFSELVLYKDNKVIKTIIHNDIGDIHDILFFQNQLYIVSTSTNEIVILDGNFSIQRRIKFDGIGDAWHLNCLEVIDNKLCVSAFCNFEKHYQYKGKTFENGFLIEVESKKIVIDKLSQPHTPKVESDVIFICNSETKSLNCYKNKILFNSIKFDNYTRGMYINENNIYLGLNKSRNIMHSEEKSKIVILNKETFEIEKKIDIPFDEVYTILEVDELIKDLEPHESPFWKYKRSMDEKSVKLKKQENAILQKNVKIKELENTILEKNKIIEEKYIIIKIKRQIEYLKGKLILIKGNMIKEVLEKIIKKLISKVMPQETRLKKILRSIYNEGIISTSNQIKDKLKIRLHKYKDFKKNMPNKSCYQNMKETFDNKNYKQLEKKPLVSILILNRNGLDHLKRLFAGIKKYDEYKNFEIIVVDNNSIDESVDFLENNPYNFSLSVIKNKENVSFSKGNNQAAEIAKGELLLLLNNDVEPTLGWLNEMVYTIQKNDSIGSVGAKLIYPYKKMFINSCKIQHAGISFRNEKKLIRPYNIGVGENPLESFLEDSEHAAVTAACLMVTKKRYLEVDGFDEDYFYGYEDVDFGLKLSSRGYRNILCSSSVLFHYEFGTQKKDSNQDIVKRRLNNINIFQKKWHHYIKEHYWTEKIELNDTHIVEKKLTVAFVVTDAGENVSEGDYFTAKELADEFKIFGWNIVYLRRKYNEWYNFSDDIDVIISLLDSYDLRKISNRHKKTITIAWARNWFDRWVENKSFNDYDIVFASSKIACEYIEDNSLKESILVPIATNPVKFNINNKEVVDKYVCDYCFTGSYWGSEREIITLLEPSLLPEFKFNIYGMNWEKIDRLKDYSKGFLPYSEMPKVYANTKIVIDDANHVTKPYGSVNSRVFDAISSGVLVITNGVLGSQNTFDGKLPYFSTKEELFDQLSFYLNNEDKRLEKIEELREIVLNNHTYEIRAQFVKKLLKERYQKKSIAIKIPAPSWDVANEWGDYHFAVALKKEFEELGYSVVLQVLNEWYNDIGSHCDIAIVLRGLSRYKTSKSQINIMWNISHPDKVQVEEYNEYDYVFISSDIWADEISKKVNIPVESLLQCTDESVFKPFEDKSSYFNELLFVGNSRKVYRTVIKDLLPTDYDLSIYGTLWEGIVDKKYIKGNHIPNEELYKYYSSANILLNDHWDDMKEKGFISNRIFDALACGAFVISDEVKGIDKILDGAIVTYKSSDDLKEKVEYYLENPLKREKIVKNGMSIVREKHTFSVRARKITEVIEKIFNNKIVK